MLRYEGEHVRATFVWHHLVTLWSSHLYTEFKSRKGCRIDEALHEGYVYTNRGDRLADPAFAYRPDPLIFEPATRHLLAPTRLVRYSLAADPRPGVHGAPPDTVYVCRDYLYHRPSGALEARIVDADYYYDPDSSDEGDLEVEEDVEVEEDPETDHSSYSPAPSPVPTDDEEEVVP